MEVVRDQKFRVAELGVLLAAAVDEVETAVVGVVVFVDDVGNSRSEVAEYAVDAVALAVRMPGGVPLLCAGHRAADDGERAGVTMMGLRVGVRDSVEVLAGVAIDANC